MLDKKFWYNIGPEVVAKFKKHTFMKARDINGDSFKGYSQEYGEAKRGNMLPRQSSEFANSKAPVLTGDLINDWKMIQEPNKSGFSFGTVSHGGKVQNLAKLGRVISSDSNPLQKHISKYIMDEAEKYTQEQLDKTKGDTFNI